MTMDLSTARGVLGVFSLAGALVAGGGCGSGAASVPDGGTGRDARPGGSGDSGHLNFGDGSAGGDASTTPACPAGLTCNVSCSGGATTSIRGTVYDPAQNNPLYNVAVYVPAMPLEPLPKGVPTGADACSCAALFKSGAVVSTTTAVDGSFELKNAPVASGGGTVPLVLQVGKWRRLVALDVKACSDNALKDKSLSLPSTVPAGDTDDNMPDIAVSTGDADTLECLMHRIGLPRSEYVAGPTGSGHVHVYAGGDPAGCGLGPGCMESPGWKGAGTAPHSYEELWDSQAHLMAYDITLLSCEEKETYSANPAVLEAYLDAGGRVFASHYHYAWFSGPLQSMQSYSAPKDWGDDLASWTPGDPNSKMGDGTIVQTLNGTKNTFPKGVALDQWLTLTGALGASHELPIDAIKYNAVVSPTNKPSQSWIQDVAKPDSTLYFSFDTPVGAAPEPDGGPPAYCGRAVFSDIHVGKGSGDTKAPPDGCSDGALTPQEKALEFMLFDLSSCVIPDSTPPPMTLPK